jgi:hypothetical protein
MDNRAFGTIASLKRGYFAIVMEIKSKQGVSSVIKYPEEYCRDFAKATYNSIERL